MISVKDLIDSIDFEPDVIYLHDNEKEIKVDYALLEEEFSFNLNCFLELVPMTGHVYFIDHAWKNEKDVHCRTSVLELLKQIDEKQNNLCNQKLSKYLLLIQDALKDLRSGDEDRIMELVYLIEAREEIQKVWSL